MELRDVVEVLASLDDERRAVTNGVHRALDALERSVLPPERFGIAPSRIEALRERIQHGLPEGPLLQEIGDAVRERLVDDARSESRKLALLAQDDPALVNASLDRFASRFGGALDHARAASEHLGALRALLARRHDADAAVTRLRARLPQDDLTTELLDLTLQARHSVDRSAPLGAHAFLVRAEEDSESSGLLAGIAANARALREAQQLGRDPAGIAADLRRRAVEAARKLWSDRDEARRHLASLEREGERRREISHAMFQAITKATEVLERLDRFERLPASQQLADGALGQLKGACLEHGIISVVASLRDVSADRADFDAALSHLSQALGDVLGLLRDRPEEAARLVPAWDDIAAVDSRSEESEWESACREALGVRRDAQGFLSVAPETLAVLVSADSLDPFRDRLFQRVETKMAEVLRAIERLEALDRALSDLCDEGGDTARVAIACKGALTRYIGEALHVMGECHARVKQRLLSPDTGFPQVERRVAPFGRLEETGGSTVAARAAAIARALADVRTLFAELESHVPGGSAGAAEAREADTRLRAESAAAQAHLAMSLASLLRLRTLLLPDLSPAVTSSIALAGAVRDATPEALREITRDQLGEALEILLHERVYHEALDLGSEADARPVAQLAALRNERLLDITGASLTLGFRLLAVLAREHDDLPEGEREPHLAWMSELLAHVTGETALFIALLDHALPELPDNASRLQRHGIALAACRDFTRAVSRTEAGAVLLRRHGDAMFAAIEEPLGNIGTTLVESLRPETADWRVTSQLESLIELHDMLLVKLRAEPTRTDIASRVEDLRARAIALRDAILERADTETGEHARVQGLFP